MYFNEKPVKILVIEDEPRDVYLLKEVLAETGVQVDNIVHFTTLEQGIFYLKSASPDVIFLDLSLPGCIGLDSFYKLQAQKCTLPIIILTSVNDTNLALNALKKGAQDFLVKGEINAGVLKKSILFSIERQRISESLRKSNERYDMVAMATNDMVWDWDLQSNKIFRSKVGWNKIIGEVPLEEYDHPDALWHRIHPEEREINNAKMTEALESPNASRFQLEYRIRRVDNSYAHVVDKGYLIRDERGNVSRLIGAMQDVTDKKIAEEELKRLSHIVKETINGIIITDKEGNITWVNESLTLMLGYSQAEIMVTDLLGFLEQINTSKIRLRYIRIRFGLMQPFECHLQVLTKAGEKRWLRMQCQPQQNADNLITGYFAIVTDISKEKIAETTLKANEKRFRSIIENSNEGLSLVDRHGNLIETSPAATKITGYLKEDYEKQENQNLIHPEDTEKVSKSFESVLASRNQVKILEYRFRNVYGHYVWLEATYHNLLHEPSINAVVIHFRNISSRKIFDEILKTSEEKYRNLFNTNPSSIFIWNPENYNILEVNDAAISHYGYTKDEFLDLKKTDLLSPVQVKEFKFMAARMLKNKSGKVSTIVLHRTKEGKMRHMEMAYHVIEYFGKNACLAIGSDISEKINLEKKLNEERLLKQQQITAAVITAQEKEREALGKELHDNINQILATSKLYIEYAMENEAMKDTLLNNAKDFIESAVYELRNLSKTLSPPSLGEVGVDMALSELVESIEKVNKFIFHTNWKDLEHHHLPVQLQLTVFRIVQEQLNNIIKHAEAKNVWITIFIKFKRLNITIRDDGKGFNLAAKKEGLGLKNIHSRSALHNGTMQLKSEPGRGCEMNLLFNLEKPLAIL